MIALLHADGKLPNLALMRLGMYFRESGEAVRLFRGARSLFDGPTPTRVYGSSIFAFSGKARAFFEREWGAVTWGGTGVKVTSNLAEIDPAVNWDAVRPDYSLYPLYEPSIGFSQRGCRLKCGFCVVPRKEGAPRAVGAIGSIWRGPPHPKRIVLLDNDFFGVPEWREHLREAREGGFKLCFSQGINIRLIDEEGARELATVEYRDNEFRERVLYTAWDSLGDEGRFREGVAMLDRAGIPPKHLRVYMLLGYRKGETFAEILYRYDTMRALGCEPYPMVFDNAARPAGLPENRTLKHFQRWAIRLARSGAIPWEKYDPQIRQRAALSAAREGRGGELARGEAG